LAPSSEIRPWYRWHWHRYRKSDRTLSLSLAAHGAYRNLLDAMWERGGWLPADRTLLWRLALATSREEYEAVADQVEAFFTLSEDGKHFTNETLAQEWQESTEYLVGIREKRSEAGKKGNAARWGDGKSSQTDRTPIANAIALPSQTGRNGSHSSSSSSSSSTEDQTLLSDETPDVCAQIVQKVFDYYREKIGKSPAYTLTPGRMAKGKARYRDAVASAKKLKPDLSREELPGATERLMKFAVDRLAASEWHNGANPHKRQYNDWDNVFRSTEEFSKWVEVEG
jgi:uncharacterized protein YdaU (DUF1376 family)